jgi:hypothetical protein
VAVAAFVRLGSHVFDPDSFYHVGYAAIYAERGPLYAEFPWLAYSLVGRYGGDIGYGFHLLLVPVTVLADPILGIRVAAIGGLAALLLMLYLVLRRHQLAYSALWPFGVVLLSPAMLGVLQMTRPHVLTTGLAVVLVSCMLRGRPLTVLLTSFAIAFIHLNISPIIPVLAIAVLVVKRLTERQWEWWKLAAATGGWALGWVFRPDPFGVAKLEYVQVFMHAAAREQGLPLIFGQEWQPLDLSATLVRYSSFLSIWVLFAFAFAAGEFSRRQLPSERRSLLWSSLLLSALFLALTLANTRRGMTLWAAFAGVFVAASFDSLVWSEIWRRSSRQRLFRALALVMLAVFALRSANAIDEIVLRPTWGSDPPDRARVAAEWLSENTPEGSVVLNVNWWDFPELFFWSTHNRYVGGLDPIFQYAYDPTLYWKVHHLELGDTLPFTCGSEVCSPDDFDGIADVLQQDFGTDFVVLDTEYNAELYQHLRGADEFQLCVEDQRLAVFRLVPASASLPASPALAPRR